MTGSQLGVIRRILLALVVGSLPATGLFAATIDAPEAFPSAVPLLWQQNLSGGMGFASLAMALPRRNTQPQTVAPLPVANSQMIFSLAPISGPVFSFARNSKVVTSTTLTQWRKSYITQAIEVTSFRVPGQPWSVQLRMGQSGALHLSVNFRDPKPAPASLLKISAVYPLETVAPAPANVPVPATLWQGGAGLLLLAGIGYRRRRGDGR